MKKTIVLIVSAICVFTSCGRDWYHSEKFFVHICPDNSLCEFIYNDRIYGKDSELCHTEVTRDTVLSCPAFLCR